VNQLRPGVRRKNAECPAQSLGALGVLDEPVNEPKRACGLDQTNLKQGLIDRSGAKEGPVYRPETK
jgi:hypothetical protein